MVNQLKIVTMTRLALYDKHEGLADRAANNYFRHDFIYKNNLGTRLAVGLGGLIILGIYWLRSFLFNELDIFEMDIQQHIVESLFFILAILAVYSLIGTIQGTRQYYLVQKRLAQYQALVRQLERFEERTHRKASDKEVPVSRPQRPVPDDDAALRYIPPRQPARVQGTPGNTGPVRRQVAPHGDGPRRQRPRPDADPRPPRPRAGRGSLEGRSSMEHTRIVPTLPRDVDSDS